MLQVVHDEEFLHTKTKNKDVYVDNSAIEYLPEDACILRQYGGKFNSTELKQVTKVLKIKY